MFAEAQRVPALDYPEADFPDPVSALVDAERRAQFREDAAHFESRYYLTLVWLPRAKTSERAARWAFEAPVGNGVDYRQTLKTFIERTERMRHLIEGFMPLCAWLDDAATLTYLHSTVSSRRQRVRLSETPCYLDAFITDEPLTGGLAPRLGDQHLKTLSITGLPSATFPGLLDELNGLAFAYRWSTRAILLDKTDATRLLAKIRRQ